MKEHADWQGGTNGWVLKPSGLALAADGGAVASTPTPDASAAVAAAGEAAGGMAAAPVHRSSRK